MASFEEDNELFRRVINAIPDPIVVKNWEGNFVLTNQSVAELYNSTPEDMVGKDDFDFTGNREQADFFRENVQSIMQSGDAQVVYEDSTDAKTGEIRHFQSLKVPFKNANNEDQIVVIARDITDVIRSKIEAEESYKQLGYVLDATQDGVWDWHIPSGKVIHNKRWFQMFALPVTEENQNFSTFQSLIHPQDKVRVLTALDLAIEYGEDFDQQYQIIKNDGSVIWVHDRGRVVERDEYNHPIRMVGAVEDISLQVAAKNKIEELAYYDPLTKLPNRRLLSDRIEMAKHKHHEQDTRSALLFLDLDHFKIINDTLGHQMGDQLLVEVANRLTTHLPEIDTVSRFGGDEFVLLINDLSRDKLTAANQAYTIAERLRESLSLPYHLTSHGAKETAIDHYLTASVGIVTFGQQESINEILKLSDLALFKAKTKGRDLSIIFDPSMQKEIDQNSELLTSLRKAVQNDEFELFYQPQFDSGNKLIGLEALLRWYQPEKGYIKPDDFIPMAEDSLLILPIGEWVLTEACKQIHAWSQHEILSQIPISINISAKQIWQKNFVALVSDLMSNFQVPKSALRMEVTESVLLHDNEDTINKLDQLTNKGIPLSLDDFGTGFSSLSYLKNLPIDEIKIDKSFVRDLESDPSDAIMVKTIVDLGKNFDIKVIAEGVENKVQLAMLKEFGCERIQGFLLGKPGPAADIESLFST